MDGLGANIRKARKQAGMTQAQLAKSVGVAQSAVTHWEAGDTRPNTVRLARLAGTLGTTVDDLLGTVPATPDCQVPLLAPLGPDSPTSVCIPPVVIASHPRACALPVVDRSMDLVVPPGMVVICDPDMRPHNGSIAVVSIDGTSPIIRRWYQGGDTIMLVAESHEVHRDIVLAADDVFRVIGPVVWIQSACPLE
jgi:SOS-response transcriptional repressor LexA